MINKDNLKLLLVTIGFTEVKKDGYYIKAFPEYGDCKMAVDFDMERLIYPTAILGGDRNTGFDQNENFVVFECVNRLLEKGYRPDSIELEKVWSLGHEQKGGRADICVYTPKKEAMLFILECKTYGAEYKKALKKTKEDGGQIFSYWQQERTTQWLGLYASDIQNGEVVYNSPIVNCSDDANIVKLAKKDESVLVYSNPKV